MRLILAALFIGSIAALPIYLGASGGIQPGHALILVFALVVLAVAKTPIPNWWVPLVLLAAWASLRELIDLFRHPSIHHFMTPAFIGFNLVIVLGVYGYILRERFAVSAMKYGVYIATAIAIAGVLLFGYSLSVSSDGMRAIGTFNNPNQLGYFGLCVGSTTVLLNRSGHLSTRAAVLLLLAAAFLTVASLSKAAMLSLAVVGAAMFWPTKQTAARFIVSALVVSAIAGGVWLAAIQGRLDNLAFYRHLMSIGMSSDDNLAARGYFAFQQGDFLGVLAGLGSMGTADILGHEVHSTIFSYFNDYGVIGISLFMVLMAFWALALHRAFGPAALLGVWAPPMFYGIAHNGSRFTFFWLLVAASFALARLAGARTARTPERPVVWTPPMAPAQTPYTGR